MSRSVSLPGRGQGGGDGDGDCDGGGEEEDGEGGKREAFWTAHCHAGRNGQAGRNKGGGERMEGKKEGVR